MPSGKQQIILSTFVESRSIGDDGSEMPSETELLVAAFNAQSDEYEVVMFIGADEEMDYATYYTKQNADLIAGTGPDLFVANSNASFPDLVQKGIMEDLLPWIERDLNPEDYIENALYAYEHNGGVYALEHSFCIFPYLVNTQTLEELTDWSFDGINAYLESHPEIKSFNGTSSMALLQDCCLYWNWQPNDIETLQDYILFAEKYGVEVDYSTQTIGQNILCQRYQVSQADAIKRYELGTDMASGTYQLMPSPGEGHPVLADGAAFSMNAASKVKEGAWEFLKYLLSEECQSAIEPYGRTPASEHAYHDGFPVKKEQYEALLEEAKTPALRSQCMTDEEIAALNEMVFSSEVGIWNFAGTPWQIVNEEVDDYYNGTKGLDQVLEIIENRLTLYLAE